MAGSRALIMEGWPDVRSGRDTSSNDGLDKPLKEDDALMPSVWEFLKFASLSLVLL